MKNFNDFDKDDKNKEEINDFNIVDNAINKHFLNLLLLIVNPLHIDTLKASKDKDIAISIISIIFILKYMQLCVIICM